jgi:uncharacterized membrane protein YkvA (DUF1232 family)
MRHEKKRAKTSPTNNGQRRTADTAPESKEFKEARNRAERFLRDPDAADKLADKADAKVGGKGSGAMSKIIAETRALIRLVRAYATGEYRHVSWESMVLVVGALIYVVSPIDVIPDVLPVGLVDDAAVIAYVLTLVHEELVEFMQWEAAGGSAATAVAA